MSDIYLDTLRTTFFSTSESKLRRSGVQLLLLPVLRSCSQLLPPPQQWAHHTESAKILLTLLFILFPPCHNYCTSLTPPPPTVLHPALKHCHQLRLAAEEFLRRSSSAVLASHPPGITRGRTGIPQSGLRPVGISTQLGTTTFHDSILMCANIFSCQLEYKE